VTLVATEGRGELEDASHDGRIAGADEEDLAKDGYADRRSHFKHLSLERPRPRERAQADVPARPELDRYRRARGIAQRAAAA